MLTFFIVIFTIGLVVDSLLLGLLILVQLPKKEAGMGMAFGGGAADALFGPGSGNALTKLTKYCAGIFFGLVLILSLMNIHAMHSSPSVLTDEMQRLQRQAPTPTTPVMTPSTNATGSNTVPLLESNILSAVSNAVKTNTSTTNPPPVK